MSGLVQPKEAHPERGAGMRELGICQTVLFVQNILCPPLQGSSRCLSLLEE